MCIRDSPHPLPSFDQKTLIQFRRVLDDYEAHLVLGLLWRASEVVSELALTAAGLSRDGESDCLNCHALAVSLSARAADLAKTNSRIRNIGIAANAFRLVERIPIHSARVDLKGTSFLHDFMIEVARESTQAMSGMASLTPDAMSANESYVSKGGSNE